MPIDHIQEEFGSELKRKFQRFTPEQLLRLPEVEAIVGLKKSKLYELIASDRFPRPVKLGTRSVRWKASSVYGWIDNLSTVNLTEEAAA